MTLPMPPDRAKPIHLAWGARVSTAFAQAVFGICREFGWGPQHASWLMACMAFETGATFSPAVRNGAGSGAVGVFGSTRYSPLLSHFSIIASTTGEW